jgi:hypothetical protein
LVASFIDFGSGHWFFGSGFFKDSWTLVFLDFLDFGFSGLWTWFFRYWFVIRQINQLTRQTYRPEAAGTRAQTLYFLGS